MVLRPSPAGGTCAWRRPSLGAVQAGVLQAAASPDCWFTAFWGTASGGHLAHA